MARKFLTANGENSLAAEGPRTLEGMIHSLDGYLPLLAEAILIEFSFSHLYLAIRESKKC